MSEPNRSTLAALVLQATGDAPARSQGDAPRQREWPSHFSQWHVEQAEAAERAAAAEQAEHAERSSIGRRVFGLIENLDAMAVPELLRRPVSKPEPIDPNTSQGRLRSFVGQIIGNNGR